MSADREEILRRVKDAVGAIEHPADYPDWPDGLAVCDKRPLDDRWAAFCERLTAFHGMPLEKPEELAEYLKTFRYTHGYCDPELAGVLAPVLGPEFTLEETFERSRLDDYRFGITRARGAIAETGTLIVTDGQTSSRLGALAPWVHVACLRTDDIFRDTAEAAAALGDDPNVIWITGPSKTADVEGILIEGVHGPGVQVCLLLP